MSPQARFTKLKTSRCFLLPTYDLPRSRFFCLIARSLIGTAIASHAAPTDVPTRLQLVTVRPYPPTWPIPGRPGRLRSRQAPASTPTDTRATDCTFAQKRNATLGGAGGAGERRGPRCWARPGPPRSPQSIHGRWRPIRRPCAHLWTAERRKQESARMHAGQSGRNLAGSRRRAGGYAPFAPAGAPLSNPPRCWPVRPSTRKVGDAKSGRNASIQKMLHTGRDRLL